MHSASVICPSQLFLSKLFSLRIESSKKYKMIVLLSVYYRDFYGKKSVSESISVWFVLILLLILSLEVNFVSDLFFSKLAKYLLLFHVQPFLLLSEALTLVFFLQLFFSNALFFSNIFNRFNFVVI